MRIKIDECVPGEIVNLLNEIGHSAETVKDEGLTGSPDHIIWEVAQNENLFLITTDLDFSDIRRYIPGTHRGILLLRLSIAFKGAFKGARQIKGITGQDARYF